jgi:hypothetical protein
VQGINGNSKPNWVLLWNLFKKNQLAENKQDENNMEPTTRLLAHIAVPFDEKHPHDVNHGQWQ